MTDHNINDFVELAFLELDETARHMFESEDEFYKRTYRRVFGISYETVDYHMSQGK